MGECSGDREYVLALVRRCSASNGAQVSSDDGHFITNTARQISSVGGSIRDIRLFAGHTKLSTTKRYIKADADAQKRVVQQLQRQNGSDILQVKV